MTNRRLISRLIFASIILMSIFAIGAPANAISSQEYSQPVKACEEIESRLRTKTEEFTQKRQQHIDKYSQISGMFISITDTLRGAGYDTVLLVELQPGMDRRIVKFADVSQTFLYELTDAADSACRDRASFNLELEEARSSLKNVQKEVSGIQDYIQQILIRSIDGVIGAAE